ncbi:MAG: hypothetical protein WDN69_05695 [Aliidongia sp.]
MDYRRNLYAFKTEPKAIVHRPMRFPVILVLDSDDGLRPIASTIKEMFGVQFSLESTDDFYHVTDNLYVVKTPENGGKKTCIEDLFPAEWRSKLLNGKKFNPASEIDQKKSIAKRSSRNQWSNPTRIKSISRHLIRC